MQWGRWWPRLPWPFHPCWQWATSALLSTEGHTFRAACRLRSLLRRCTDHGRRGSGPPCRQLLHEGNERPFRCRRCSPWSAFFRQPRKPCPPKLSCRQIVRTPTRDRPSRPHRVAWQVLDRGPARRLHFLAAVWAAYRSNRSGSGRARGHRTIHRRACRFPCRAGPTGHNPRRCDASREHRPAAFVTKWLPQQRD